MKKESDVKDAVRKALMKFGPRIWWFMPPANGFGTPGVPDFVCSIGGRFVGIETKFGKNGLTKWQIKQMEGIIGTGAAHMVINENNVGSVEAVIAGILALEDK